MTTQVKKLRNILIRVRELILQGWCQGDPAQDATRKAVSSRDIAACRWCLVGAMKRAKWENYGLMDLIWREDPLYDMVLSQLPSTVQRLSLSSYNDLPTTTQQDVIAVLDRAIAQAK